MEGCSKRSAGAVSGLPDDPLVEIISRVPAKSVCRFKCVSKAWRDLIAHPDHRKKLRQPMQGLFVQTLETSEVDGSKRNRRSFSFIDLLTSRSVPLDVDPCISFLKEVPGINTSFFLGSCDGLILFGNRKEPSDLSGDYIVCNPTTKQWLAVPTCGSRAAFSHTTLAFDPAVSSHFHLVQFQMAGVDDLMPVVSLHVYSSETGTWGRNQIDEQKGLGQLEGWHHQFRLAEITRHCAFVNGFVHLIVFGSDELHILAVDVQGKARRMITRPGMAGGSDMRGSCYLGQSQGHLHSVTAGPPYIKKQKIYVWVLQDYDNQEWLLKNTLDTRDVFGESLTDLSVVDIHPDRNVVFFLRKNLGCNWKLIAYDMDRKEVSIIATFEDRKSQFDVVRYVPYFSELPALTNKH